VLAVGLTPKWHYSFFDQKTFKIISQNNLTVRLRAPEMPAITALPGFFIFYSRLSKNGAFLWKFVRS
jgi:hypothetical protein